MERKIQITKFFGFPKAPLFCAIAFQTKCFVSNSWICHCSLSGHHFLFVFEEWWWFFLVSGGDIHLFLLPEEQLCLCFIGIRTRVYLVARGYLVVWRDGESVGEVSCLLFPPFEACFLPSGACF